MPQHAATCVVSLATAWLPCVRMSSCTTCPAGPCAVDSADSVQDCRALAGVFARAPSTSSKVNPSVAANDADSAEDVDTLAFSET